MKRRNKKGISPLIATVLVIGFTIVLAALVITWGTKLFKTTVSETETASKVSLACTVGLKLEVLDSTLDDTNTQVTLNLRNNNQDRAIDGFRAVLNFNTGTSEEGSIASSDGVMVLQFPVPKKYTINGVTTTDLTNLESIALYPQFEIEGDIKACENSENIKV